MVKTINNLLEATIYLEPICFLVVSERYTLHSKHEMLAQRGFTVVNQQQNYFWANVSSLLGYVAFNLYYNTYYSQTKNIRLI